MNVARSIAIGAIVLTALIGCKKTHVEEDLYIYGGPEQNEDWYGQTYVIILSDPLIETATVTVNDRVMVQEEYYGPTHAMAFRDTLYPQPKIRYNLEVNTSIGNASASCMMPGDFIITSPVDNIPLNTKIDIVWTASDSAEWYMVYVYYYWYDTVSYQDGEKDTTFITHGNSATLSTAWSSYYGDIEISVCAGSGPEMEGGAQGNINGAKGFWIGINQQNIWAYVGSKGTAREPAIRPELNGHEMFANYLGAIAEGNEEIEELLKLLK